MNLPTNNTPSEHLLNLVKATLVLKGLSLSAYCRDRDMVRQNVSAALTGKWRGPKAQKTIYSVLNDLGLSEC